MKKTLWGVALAAASLAASAADGLVEFNGGIGSQPFALVGGVVAPNDVFGVAPGGRPWVIRDLRARVDTDGTIRVRGQGLEIAGGNATGTPALPRQVAATLFCGGTPSSSAGVDVDAAGDFTIRGALTPAPAQPCTGPVLLIRNFANNAPGAWFAAGILATN